jgi:hypothetical protein
MDLDPGDGVFGGIEVGWAAQNFRGDRIFANLCVLAREVLLADVLEQFDRTLGAREGRRSENRREFQTFRARNSGRARSSVIGIPQLWRLYTFPQCGGADSQV